MKIADLRSKSEDQLHTMLSDLKKESFNLRFQKVSGALEKTSRVREVRRTIAQIKTLLKETSLGINKGKAVAKAVKKPAKKAAKTAKTAKKKSKEAA